MRWLTKGALAARIGVTHPTLTRMLEAGQFPPGTEIHRTRRWSEDLVEAWIRQQGALPESERHERERQPEAREVG